MKLELEKEFSVPVPLERAWADLLDAGGLVRCIPSGVLRRLAGGDGYGGTLEIGAAAVHGTLRPVDSDDDDHTASFLVEGREAGGAALGTGLVVGRLTAGDGLTSVALRVDLRVAGMRGGDDVIRHTGALALEDFTRRLEHRMLSDERREPPVPDATVPHGPPVVSSEPEAPARGVAAAAAAVGLAALAGLALRRRRHRTSIVIRIRG